MKKKHEERSMMSHLLTENNRCKAKREEEKMKEKEQDVAIQKAYIEMLDKQERD